MQGLEAASPVAQNVVAQTSPWGIDPEGEVEGEVQLFLPGKVGAIRNDSRTFESCVGVGAGFEIFVEDVPRIREGSNARRKQ